MKPNTYYLTQYFVIVVYAVKWQACVSVVFYWILRVQRRLPGQVSAAKLRLGQLELLA
jgi:hypothetical protein